MRKFHLPFALAAAAVLSACSASAPSGPQLHPGDFVRQQMAAQSGQGTMKQVVTPVVAMQPGGTANPSTALAAFDQFCAPNVSNLSSVDGRLRAAGYQLWQTVETSAAGATEFASVYRKPGVAHAVFLQKFASAPAPYVCGVDSPDTAALRQSIGAKMSGFPPNPRAAAAVGAQNVWTVNGAPHISIVSVAPKYEWGPTRSFALVARRT